MDDVVDRKNPPAGDSPPEHFFGRVLKPAELLDHAQYSMPAEVTEELRPWVRRYWAVTWDLPEGELYQTATVSEPGINLTFEFGDIYRANTSGAGLWLTGPVTSRRFDVGLYGRGGVIGVNFHLGGTLAFANESPALIRDTTVRAGVWFPGIDKELGIAEELGTMARLGASETLGREEELNVDQNREVDLRSGAEALERWLLSLHPRMTEGYARFRQVVELLEDPSVISLGELSSRSGMSERSLQRMFQEYCDVGVKRILIRARVRDAVAALDTGWNRSLTEIATLFGWFDQSHFTADFHRVTGYTPNQYLSAHKRRGQSQS